MSHKHLEDEGVIIKMLEYGNTPCELGNSDELN